MALHSRIVTAAVIPQADDSRPDLLAVTLASGFVLFINLVLWKVTEALPLGRHSPGQLSFPIDHPGWQISPDSHGKTVSLAAFRNKLRLHAMASQDSHALDLPSSNILLHTCFLFPLKGVNAQHLFFLTLYVAENSRLKLGVYEWWTQSPLKSLSYNCTAQLPPLFTDMPPIFVVPIPHSDGALVLITADRVFFLKLPDIISARQDYQEVSLPSFPVAYHQERIANSSVQATYNTTQRIYIGTESNFIYTVTIDAANDQVSIQPLVDLESSIGSSLVLSPCTDQGDLDPTTSINDAAHLMVETAGAGVIGGTFFVQSTDDGVVVDYLSDYQAFGPVGDAIALNHSDAYESVSPSLINPPKPELFISSGIGSSSSAIVHVRQGLKATIALEGLPMLGVKQLFRAVSADSSCYFIASYPFYSSIFQVLQSEGGDNLEIVDFSEASQLNLEAETLAFAAVGSALVQVTANSLIVTSKDNRLALDNLSILRACIDGEHIALAYRKDSQTSLALYKLNPDLLPSNESLQLLGEALVDTEITMLKFINQAIYLGTFASTLRIYTPNLEFQETQLQDLANDAVRINDTLLIGLRSGAIRYQSGDAVTSRPLGKLPVQFIQHNDKTFALCEHLYAIDHSLPSDVPHRVVVDDSNLFSLQAACFFPVLASTESEIVVAAVMNQKLTILVVPPEPGLVTRRIPIRAVPRRLLYLSHIGMIAVLFHRSCKKSRRSHLRFVDPRRGTVVTPGEENYDQWKQKPSRNGDEVMYCMCEWEFRVADKRFKYLVLGSGASGGARPCGYLYVMTVSKTKSGRVEIQKRFALLEEDPIYSVAQIDDKTLICATKNSLVLYMLLIDDQKCKILRLGTLDNVSSPVINLSVHGGLIFASTLKNSLLVYHYSVDQGLRLICSDSVLRGSVTQCVLNDGTIIIADKQRNVAAFTVPQVDDVDDTVRVSNSTLMVSGSVMLPSVIARLIPVPGADENSQDVWAIGIDGSMYKLQFLSETAALDLVNVVKDASKSILHQGIDETLPLESTTWREELLKTKHVIDWEYVYATVHNDGRIRDFTRLHGVL